MIRGTGRACHPGVADGSLYTAELCGADAFDYLVALLRHHRALRESPRAWTPWNYRATLASLATAPGPLP